MNTVEQEASRSVRVIALFEAAKGGLALAAAALLLAVGADALRRQIERLLGAFGMDANAVSRSRMLRAIDSDALHLVAAVLLVYALMRAIEAWGLWHHRLWASWLGCIGAAIYLPFELHALLRQPHWLTAAVLLVNLLVVVVLAKDIRQRRTASS